MSDIREMTKAGWLAEGKRLFGGDYMDWKFECPICHNVAAVGDFREFKDRGATPDSATKECIGRYLPATKTQKSFGDEPMATRPCDYAGYGLLRVSPVRVLEDDGGEATHSFAFADCK